MVTEEELAQMSPEQIAQFQKQNCIFCQIASGAVPSQTVYSDNDSIAVLDINPAAKGHMLLMPKEHYSVMPQIPVQLAENIFMVAKGLSQAALKGMHCKGTTIFVANGVAAGQRAPHFMVHIIPRWDSDGVALAIPSKLLSKKDMDAAAALLSRALKGRKVEAQIVKEEPSKVPKVKTPKKKVAKPKTSKKVEPKKEEFNLDDVSSLFS